MNNPGQWGNSARQYLLAQQHQKGDLVPAGPEAPTVCAELSQAQWERGKHPITPKVPEALSGTQLMDSR